MPTYQYACTSCGHQLEAVQSFSDAALTVCPECDGNLRKVFSAVGIVFKGSGFYRTDSRSDNSDKKSTTSSTSTTSTASDSSSSTSTSTSTSTSPTPAAASSSSTSSTAAASTAA